MKKMAAILLAVVLAVTSVSTVPSQAQAYSVPSNMKWWAQDKFGMFIHFGAYSYYGQGEWAMSEQKISKKKYQTTIAAKFNPTKFNADEIVKYAKNAGMKYIVITAKHHEGLAMWDRWKALRIIPERRSLVCSSIHHLERQGVTF